MSFYIRNADCASALKDIAGDSIALTVTSPPYDSLRTYNGYTFDFESIAKELYRVTKPGGVVVWVVNDATVKGSETGTSFKQALFFKECGFNLHDTMIYDKGAAGGAKGSNYCYWQAFEFMFVFSKGRPSAINLICDKPNIEAGKTKQGIKQRLPDGTMRTRDATHIYPAFGRRTNLWKIPAGKGHSATDTIAYQHPAIFPEALARDHILSWSNPGDLILDPFMGSGTTGKMAIQELRQFVGIEISAEYCEIARQRILTVIPKAANDAEQQTIDFA